MHSSGALQGTKTQSSAAPAQGCSGGRVTEQGGCWAASEACNVHSQKAKGGRSREGRCGGRGVWAARGQISSQRPQCASTSLSLASRPPCLCRALTFCRPASPSCAGPHVAGKLLWAFPAGPSAQAQRPGGRGRDWSVCMWPKRPLGAQDSAFLL